MLFQYHQPSWLWADYLSPWLIYHLGWGWLTPWNYACLLFQAPPQAMHDHGGRYSLVIMIVLLQCYCLWVVWFMQN
jgi:hypothetical protein